MSISVPNLTKISSDDPDMSKKQIQDGGHRHLEFLKSVIVQDGGRPPS